MKTKRSYLSMLMAAAMVLPSTSWSLTGDVTVGTEVFMGEHDNAKFREYRYKTDSPLGLYTVMDLRAEPGESRFYRMGLKARTNEDVGLKAEAGAYGIYRFGLSFSRMGHNFAFGAKNIYAGAGTGRLTLPDSLQSFLQASTAANLVSRLRPVADAAGEINLGLRRDRLGADFAWELSEPLRLTVAAGHEKRKGTRPFGGTFGFGNALEIPEPIDYDTSSLREGLEYHGKGFHAGVSHSLSLFKNANASLTYDSPFRNVDSTASNAYSQNIAAGPAVGRTALAPDNVANHLEVFAAKSLAAHARLATHASLGWLRQNEKLLPVTTNSAITGYPLPLPRASAQAKVDTRVFGAELSVSPIKKLHVKAGYRYDQHQNNTPVFTISRWVVADANLYAGGAKSSNYVSVVKRIGELEAAYDILSKTTLSLGVENEHANYNNGSARKEGENIYKASLETRRIKATELRLTLEHANKNSDYPDYASASLELPWMRKYYAASRDRNRAVFMATVMPGDETTLGLEYTYGRDDYPKSEFGLRDSRYHTVSLDADMALGGRVTLAPFYTFEVYETNQRNRQWNPGAIGDPYGSYRAIDTYSNWTVQYRDIVQTPGLNLEIVVVPDRLNISASGSVAVADNRRDFASAVGTSTNDVNAFVPEDSVNADDNVLISLNARVDYSVKKDISVGLGYLYQRWKVEDNFLYNGYDRVYVNSAGQYGGLLSMDTMYKPYNVHAVYVQGSCRF